MRRGGVYRHENCTDVAIEVLKVQYHDHKRVRLKVSWINVVNPKNHYAVGIAENIEIKREDLHKWKELEDLHD